MSWWVYLERDNEPVEVERHTEGGTYAIGGIDTAELNVTYNYARLFDYRALDGKRAEDTITGLSAAVSLLGTERDQDYWKPAPGNAGFACSILLAWARQHPDATWRVS